jgi:stalled ribosome alternative rescue factor ArfA
MRTPTKRNPMAHELVRNTLFRTKVERKLVGRGSYQRNTKHKKAREDG